MWRILCICPRACCATENLAEALFRSEYAADGFPRHSRRSFAGRGGTGIARAAEEFRDGGKETGSSGGREPGIARRRDGSDRCAVGSGEKYVAALARHARHSNERYSILCE